MSEDLFKYVVFKDAEWNFLTLDVAQHLDMSRTAAASTIDATSPDLTSFIDRGGTLLIYHGWGDTNVPPRSSVNYYNRVVDTVGASTAGTAVRLFMVPGMGHCGGGEGPNQFDPLAAVEAWRERTTPPAQMLASQIVDGKVVRTRPLCAYPQVPRYTGAGSIDRAENFVCR